MFKYVKMRLKLNIDIAIVLGWNMKNKKNENKQKVFEKIKNDRNQRILQNKQSIELKKIRENLKWHKILRMLIKINNGYIEKMNKDYYTGLKEELSIYEGRPIIFAPNHVRMQDIEVQMEACPFHQVLLSGDYMNVNGSLAGILLEKNGIVYFDMNDKSDRKNVQNVIYDILQNNYNLLWYYEGTWCVSPNKPYNDGSFQIVQTAIDTNAIVVPIAFDMVDNKIAVIKYDKPIDYNAIYGKRKLTVEEKIEALDLLKGMIGKSLFEIWDEYNHVNRDDLVRKYAPELLDYPNLEETFEFKPPNKYGVLHKCWDEYLEKILSEWNFTLEDLEEKRFKANDVVSQEEVFSHLYKIKPSKNNAFLFSKKNHH